MAKRRASKNVDKRLVNDRINFLLSDDLQFPKTATFRTRAEAVDFAAEQMATNGLDYDIKKGSRTARLMKPDIETVRHSTSMRQIRDDLRTKSKRPGGKRARALEALGRRESFFDWPVGETPS